jgi:hypothetical protein
MDGTANASSLDSESRPVLGLPPQARFLCAGRVEPSWVSLTLQLDAAGCHEPSLRWMDDPSRVLTLLREESFDALVFEAEFCRSAPGDGVAGAFESPLGELALLQALRGGGCLDPVVVLSSRPSDQLVLEVERLEAELLVTPASWYSPALGVTLRRAVERARLVQDHYRLAVTDRRRSLRDREEAAGLLNEQRRIITDLLEETVSAQRSHSAPQTDRSADRQASETGVNRPTELRDVSGRTVPPELRQYYQELLRTFVIIGSGSLVSEIRKFAEEVAAAGLTPRQVMRLHLGRVEELVSGLGSRSSRHILGRADLLALEVMIYLAECYQRSLTARPSATV